MEPLDEQQPAGADREAAEAAEAAQEQAACADSWRKHGWDSVQAPAAPLRRRNARDRRSALSRGRSAPARPAPGERREP